MCTMCTMKTICDCFIFIVCVTTVAVFLFFLRKDDNTALVRGKTRVIWRKIDDEYVQVSVPRSYILTDDEKKYMLDKDKFA